MKFLNLSLDFSLDLYLTFKEFGQSTQDVIATLFNLIDFFALDFLQKSSRYFLFSLWDNEIDTPKRSKLMKQNKFYLRFIRDRLHVVFFAAQIN